MINTIINLQSVSSASFKAAFMILINVIIDNSLNIGLAYEPI